MEGSSSGGTGIGSSPHYYKGDWKAEGRFGFGRVRTSEEYEIAEDEVTIKTYTTSRSAFERLANAFIKYLTPFPAKEFRHKKFRHTEMTVTKISTKSITDLHEISQQKLPTPIRAEVFRQMVHYFFRTKNRESEYQAFIKRVDAEIDAIVKDLPIKKGKTKKGKEGVSNKDKEKGRLLSDTNLESLSQEFEKIQKKIEGEWKPGTGQSKSPRVSTTKRKKPQGAVSPGNKEEILNENEHLGKAEQIDLDKKKEKEVENAKQFEIEKEKELREEHNVGISESHIEEITSEVQSEKTKVIDELKSIEERITRKIGDLELIIKEARSEKSTVDLRTQLSKLKQHDRSSIDNSLEGIKNYQKERSEKLNELEEMVDASLNELEKITKELDEKTKAKALEERKKQEQERLAREAELKAKEKEQQEKIAEEKKRAEQENLQASERTKEEKRIEEAKNALINVKSSELTGLTSTISELLTRIAHKPVDLNNQAISNEITKLKAEFRDLKKIEASSIGNDHNYVTTIDKYINEKKQGLEDLKNKVGKFHESIDDFISAREKISAFIQRPKLSTVFLGEGQQLLKDMLNCSLLPQEGKSSLESIKTKFADLEKRASAPRSKPVSQPVKEEPSTVERSAIKPSKPKTPQSVAVKAQNERLKDLRKNLKDEGYIALVSMMANYRVKETSEAEAKALEEKLNQIQRVREEDTKFLAKAKELKGQTSDASLTSSLNKFVEDRNHIAFSEQNPADQVIKKRAEALKEIEGLIIQNNKDRIVEADKAAIDKIQALEKEVINDGANFSKLFPNLKQTDLKDSALQNVRSLYTYTVGAWAKGKNLDPQSLKDAQFEDYRTFIDLEISKTKTLNTDLSKAIQLKTKWEERRKRVIEFKKEQGEAQLPQTNLVNKLEKFYEEEDKKIQALEDDASLVGLLEKSIEAFEAKLRVIEETQKQSYLTQMEALEKSGLTGDNLKEFTELRDLYFKFVVDPKMASYQNELSGFQRLSANLGLSSNWAGKIDAGLKREQARLEKAKECYLVSQYVGLSTQEQKRNSLKNLADIKAYDQQVDDLCKKGPGFLEEQFGLKELDEAKTHYEQELRKVEEELKEPLASNSIPTFVPALMKEIKKAEIEKSVEDAADISSIDTKEKMRDAAFFLENAAGKLAKIRTPRQKSAQEYKNEDLPKLITRLEASESKPDHILKLKQIWVENMSQELENTRELFTQAEREFSRLPIAFKKDSKWFGSSLADLEKKRSQLQTLKDSLDTSKKGSDLVKQQKVLQDVIKEDLQWLESNNVSGVVDAYQEFSRVTEEVKQEIGNIWKQEASDDSKLYLSLKLENAFTEAKRKIPDPKNITSDKQLKSYMDELSKGAEGLATKLKGVRSEKGQPLELQTLAKSLKQMTKESPEALKTRYQSREFSLELDKSRDANEERKMAEIRDYQKNVVDKHATVLAGIGDTNSVQHQVLQWGLGKLTEDLEYATDNVEVKDKGWFLDGPVGKKKLEDLNLNELTQHRKNLEGLYAPSEENFVNLSEKVQQSVSLEKDLNQNMQDIQASIDSLSTYQLKGKQTYLVEHFENKLKEAKTKFENLRTEFATSNADNYESQMDEYKSKLKALSEEIVELRDEVSDQKARSVFGQYKVTKSPKAKQEIEGMFQGKIDEAKRFLSEFEKRFDFAQKQFQLPESYKTTLEKYVSEAFEDVEDYKQRWKEIGEQLDILKKLRQAIDNQLLPTVEDYERTVSGVSEYKGLYSDDKTVTGKLDRIVKDAALAQKKLKSEFDEKRFDESTNATDDVINFSERLEELRKTIEDELSKVLKPVNDSIRFDDEKKATLKKLKEELIQFKADAEKFKNEYLEALPIEIRQTVWFHDKERLNRVAYDEINNLLKLPVKNAPELNNIKIKIETIKKNAMPIEEFQKLKGVLDQAEGLFNSLKEKIVQESDEKSRARDLYMSKLRELKKGKFALAYILSKGGNLDKGVEEYQNSINSIRQNISSVDFVNSNLKLKCVPVSKMGLQEIDELWTAPSEEVTSIDRAEFKKIDEIKKGLSESVRQFPDGVGHELLVGNLYTELVRAIDDLSSPETMITMTKPGWLGQRLINTQFRNLEKEDRKTAWTGIEASIEDLVKDFNSAKETIERMQASEKNVSKTFDDIRKKVKTLSEDRKFADVTAKEKSLQMLEDRLGSLRENLKADNLYKSFSELNQIVKEAKQLAGEVSKAMAGKSIPISKQLESTPAESKEEVRKNVVKLTGGRIKEVEKNCNTYEELVKSIKDESLLIRGTDKNELAYHAASIQKRIEDINQQYTRLTTGTSAKDTIESLDALIDTLDTLNKVNLPTDALRGFLESESKLNKMLEDQEIALGKLVNQKPPQIQTATLVEEVMKRFKDENSKLLSERQQRIHDALNPGWTFGTATKDVEVLKKTLDEQTSAIDRKIEAMDNEFKSLLARPNLSLEDQLNNVKNESWSPERAKKVKEAYFKEAQELVDSRKEQLNFSRDQLIPPKTNRNTVLDQEGIDWVENTMKKMADWEALSSGYQPTSWFWTLKPITVTPDSSIDDLRSHRRSIEARLASEKDELAVIDLSDALRAFYAAGGTELSTLDEYRKNVKNEKTARAFSDQLKSFTAKLKAEKT